MEKYSLDWFKEKASKGGRKRWEGKSPADISAYMSAIAKRPRKKRKFVKNQVKSNEKNTEVLT